MSKKQAFVPSLTNNVLFVLDRHDDGIIIEYQFYEGSRVLFHIAISLLLVYHRDIVSDHGTELLFF